MVVQFLIIFHLEDPFNFKNAQFLSAANIYNND